MDQLDGNSQQYLHHLQQATQRVYVPQMRTLLLHLLLCHFNKLNLNCLFVLRLLNENKITVPTLGCSDASANSKAAGIISKFIIAFTSRWLWR